MRGGEADLAGFRGRSKEGGNGLSNDARGTMMNCSVNEPGESGTEKLARAFWRSKSG